MEELNVNNKRSISYPTPPQRKRATKNSKRRGTRGKIEGPDLHHEPIITESKTTFNDSLDGTELLIIDDQSPVASEIESKAKHCQAKISKTFHAGISHLVFPHSASNSVNLFKSFYTLISNYSPTIKLLPIVDNDIKYGSSIVLCFSWPDEIIPQEVFVVSQFWVQDCYLCSYRPPEGNYISAIFCSLFPKTLRKAMHYTLDNSKVEQLNKNIGIRENNLGQSSEPSRDSEKYCNSVTNLVEHNRLNPQDIAIFSEKAENLHCNYSSTCESIGKETSPEFEDGPNSPLTTIMEPDLISSKSSYPNLEKYKNETKELKLPFDNLELSASATLECSNANTETYSNLNSIQTLKEYTSAQNFSTSIDTNEENMSFIEMERNRPESEIEVPKVGSWVETKSNHEDSQIFKAKVQSAWQVSGTWMFRLKSPDIVSTYVEPLKNVRVENIWSNNLLLDLGRGRKSRRSSKSLCTIDTSTLPHNRSARNSESMQLDSKKASFEHEDIFYKTNDSKATEKESITMEAYKKQIDNIKLIKDEIDDSSSIAKSTCSPFSENEEKVIIDRIKSSISDPENDGENQNILNLVDSSFGSFIKSPNNIAKTFYSKDFHSVFPINQGIEIVETEREMPSKANLNARLNGQFRVLILEDALKFDETLTLRKILAYANENLPSPFDLDNHKYFKNNHIKHITS